MLLWVWLYTYMYTYVYVHVYANIYMYICSVCAIGDFLATAGRNSTRLGAKCALFCPRLKLKVTFKRAL